MFSILKKHVYILCLAWIVSGCNFVAEIVTPTIIPVSSNGEVSTATGVIPSSTEPSSPPVSVDITPRLLSSGEEFPVGSYSRLWWSTDSEILSYWNAQGVWECSINSGETVFTGNEPFSTIMPSISPLPQNVMETSVSPSGRITIYLTLLEVPGQDPAVTTDQASTPTLSGNSQGEGNPSVAVGTLWIQEDGIAQAVGIIGLCHLNYIWNPDETLVVANPIDPLGACQETDSWLIDTQAPEMMAILTNNEYSHGTDVYEFSPDSHYLLYSGNHYGLLDVESLLPIELNLSTASYVRFINPQILVVLYESGNGWRLGEYDWVSMVMREVVSFSRVSELVGLRPIQEMISPDRRWIAFLAGTDRYSANSVWLMELTTPVSP